MNSTDFELIIKAKNGDSEAVGRLYENFRAKGLAIARQYVKNQDDAEDMYQDSFLKAITNLDRFDPSKEFGPWIDTIIVNTCKNYLVKKRAINFSDMSDEESEFIDTIDDKDAKNAPDLSYDRKEFMEIMEGIINELPQAQKEAVTLFYYKEMSVRDIAKLQDVPEDTVKSRLNYSRKKLETKIEEYEKKTGIKLYGTTLSTLLLILFFKNSAYAAEAESFLSVSTAGGGVASATSAGSASTTAEGMAAASASATSSNVAKMAALSAARKSLLVTALKILVPLSAVVLVGASIHFAGMNKDDNQKPKVNASEEEYSIPKVTQKVNKDIEPTKKVADQDKKRESEEEEKEEFLPGSQIKHAAYGSDTLYKELQNVYEKLEIQRTLEIGGLGCCGHIKGLTRNEDSPSSDGVITFTDMYVYISLRDEQAMGVLQLDYLEYGEWKGAVYKDHSWSTWIYKYMGDDAYDFPASNKVIKSIPEDYEGEYFCFPYPANSSDIRFMDILSEHSFKHFFEATEFDPYNLPEF